MVVSSFTGRGVGFGVGVGCGFGVGWGFGGGGCGVGLGLGWGFGVAYGTEYVDSTSKFEGMNFDELKEKSGKDGRSNISEKMQQDYIDSD